MKKMLILTMVILCGCSEEQANRFWRGDNYKTPEQYALEYELRQAELVAKFKEAYPEKWEQKLLEYQLEEERFNRQQALSNQEYLNQLLLMRGPNLYDRIQQQRLYDAQYNYYTRPYKVGDVLYVPARP